MGKPIEQNLYFVPRQGFIVQETAVFSFRGIFSSLLNYTKYSVLVNRV